MIYRGINIKNKKILVGIIIIGVALRFLTAFFYVGVENIDQQEYGDIAENIVNGKGYSFYYYDGSELVHNFNSEASPQPSAYMPPLYTFLIAPLKFAKDIYTENLLIILLHLTFFAISSILLFEICMKLFNVKVSLVAVILYVIVPEFIYGSISIGTTQTYHLLALMFIYGVISKRNYYFLGVNLGLLILLRFEMIILLPVLSFYLIKRFNKKYFVLMSIIALLILSPWVARNSIVFDEFIPFSTSGGLNIYRGNNEQVIGNWHNEETLEFIRNSKDKALIESKLSDKYLEEFKEYISNNTIDSVIGIGKKIVYVLTIYPHDNKTQSPFYYVPWLIILLTAIVGFRKSRTETLYYFISIHLLIAIVFLPLPRYLTMMKIFLLPYSANYIQTLFSKKS